MCAFACDNPMTRFFALQRRDKMKDAHAVGLSES